MRPTSDALQTLLAAIGEADTVKLIQALGGTRWHVPAKLPDCHPWATTIGYPAATKLAQACQGETGLRIPRDQGVIDRLIAEAARGRTQNDLAVMFQRDLRSIQAAIKRHYARQLKDRQREAQRDLFA